jgi:threonine aldolase
MYSFRNDYSEGAHPAVLEALMRTNGEQTCGYGLDPYCQAAAAEIRRLCGAAEADVHFLVGGTQANLVVIDAALQSYEAAIAAESGHISVHETGAIEATGHKVCTIPAPEGKLTPALVEAVLAGHNGTEHMVLPRLVYISDTTEIGTLYTKAELTALRRCCDAHGLLLYLDGARLGSALTAPGNDLTLPDLSALTDAFTIGGTKNGALFGEAVVLGPAFPREHFRWHMKQRGAVLAKGRLLGIQFQALLKDDLYFDLARRANETARKLRLGLEALGLPFPVPSPSNQQFPVLPNTAVAGLEQMGYEFEIDAPVDETHTRVRFVTSWATSDEAVEHLLADLGNLLRGAQ